MFSEGHLLGLKTLTWDLDFKRDFFISAINYKKCSFA